MTDVRPELPPMPTRIAALPVHRGYPVPWFVAWLDEDENPTLAGVGTPDFRVLRPDWPRAHSAGLCWVCGGSLGRYRAFVLGPMCAVNRTSAEPPAHLECAEWSARACPFLTRPHMMRREAGKPAAAQEPAGIMLRRNPGVALVWVTRRYGVRPVEGGGLLFHIGEPHQTFWFCEGREATRAEIDASIESGLPALVELAEAQSEAAVTHLEWAVERARALLPAA